MIKATFFTKHWKKLAFASVPIGYGLYTLKSRYEITRHMNSICSEVIKYADHQSNSNLKRVLVVVNPVANKKKAESKFNKYCEPILHLAGYTVEILKTNHVGHAKTFIENMKVLPDAIVVAGGDGTSSEVVTGLMRRDESPCPIVVLPLGCKNQTALKYSGFKPNGEIEYVKTLSNTVLFMIQEKLRYENVIKYDVIRDNDNNIENQPIKPIYGLNQFSWGLLRDIDSVKDKYWYFGYLRHYAATFFSSFSKDLNWNLSTDFVYTPPCPGCRTCSISKENKTPTSYFRKLLPIKGNLDMNKIYVDNKDCDTQVHGKIQTSQLNIACKHNTSEFYELETNCINPITPGFNLIKNIVKVTNNDIEPSMTLKCRTISLVPASSVENNGFYSIDGEEYDVRPIKVSIVPNAIKVFC